MRPGLSGLRSPYRGPRMFAVRILGGASPRHRPCHFPSLSQTYSSALVYGPTTLASLVAIEEVAGVRPLIKKTIQGKTKSHLGIHSAGEHGSTGEILAHTMWQSPLDLPAGSCAVRRTGSDSFQEKTLCAALLDGDEFVLPNCAVCQSRLRRSKNRAFSWAHEG